VKSTLVLFAFVLIASPALAGLIGAPEAVPPDADFVAALSIGPGSLVKNLSMFSLAQKRAEAVVKEHVDMFAKEYGVDLNGGFSLVVAGVQAKPDHLVISGRLTVDTALLAKALEATKSKHGLTVEKAPKGLIISEKQAALVVNDDGSFVGGKKETVLALKTGASAPLAGELAERAGENATFAALAELPGGIPGKVPPNLAGQPIAGLWTRVRGVFGALKEKDVAVEFAFDEADSAKAAEPIILGWLKTIDGAVGTQVAAAEQAARAKTPVNYLDPTWIAARVSHETIKEITAQLAIGVNDKRLAFSFPHGVFTGSLGNPMMTTAIVGVLAAIAVPNFKAARERANLRACYATQKTIVGATEMYNLDKNTKVTELTPKFFEELRSGGYLQSIPQDPGQGAGTEMNYVFVPDGNGIACKVHGSIDGSHKPAHAR
jgi:competence protein ComGC